MDQWIHSSTTSGQCLVQILQGFTIIRLWSINISTTDIIQLQIISSSNIFRHLTKNALRLGNIAGEQLHNTQSNIIQSVSTVCFQTSSKDHVSRIQMIIHQVDLSQVKVIFTFLWLPFNQILQNAFSSSKLLHINGTLCIVQALRAQSCKQEKQ